MATDEALPTTYKQTVYYRIGRFRMPFTYAMVVLAIVLATDGLLLPGLAVIAVGMLIRVWAAGHVVKKRKLSMGGPYAYLRNPLYLGSLIGGIGAFVLIQNWWMLPVFLAGFALFYGAAIRSEEDYMRERHGAEFARYMQTVPSLIPRIIPASTVSESRFAWHDVCRNDEHKALLWSLLGILAIVVRAYFL